MEEQLEITVGQNLRRIRKDLDLKQHQIAGEDITRNLISLIENDKAVLYDTAANIMARNINKIMSEKNLNIFIKPEDLLNPERYNARKKADTYIERIENNLINKIFDIELEELNEIEAFLNEWDLTDKQVRIYELLGDIFYASNNLSKEYYYYFKALESSYKLPNMKDRYKIALKLVYNCIITGKFEEAISLCKYMLLSQRDIPDKTKGILHYNIALSYRKLDEIHNSLRELGNAKNYITNNNKKEMNKILLLESACYSKIGDLDRALDNFNRILELLDKNTEIDEVCVAYINIIQIYIQKNDTKNVIKYFDKMMIKLPYINEDSYYLPEIYYHISNIYSYMNNFIDSDKYLKTALALAKKNDRKSLYKKFISKQIELYINANWPDKLDKLTTNIREEVLNFSINPDFKLVLELVLYYIRQNSYDTAQSLILDILKKEEEE